MLQEKPDQRKLLRFFLWFYSLSVLLGMFTGFACALNRHGICERSTAGALKAVVRPKRPVKLHFAFDR